jgi:endonuclease/exonuclease/phosphatase family metal-dependent hydrolase
MRARLTHPHLTFWAGVLSVVVFVGVTHAGVKATPDRDITVANLNILHGFACDSPFPRDGDQCRVEDRIDLLIQHVLAVGCPDIITLQENVTSKFVLLTDPNDPTQVELVGPLTDTVELIEDRLDDLESACGFPYEVIFDPTARRHPAFGRGIDEELILSRYPALDFKVVPLYSPLFPFFFRHVLFARIDHPFEPVDVYTAHLAAGADFGDALCGISLLGPIGLPCPDACETSDTVRECQAKQMVRFIEATHTIPGAGIITGDFNAPPSSNVYSEFTRRGWIDSHLEAGNAECDPETGLNCTSGREGDSLRDLESPELNQQRRIDYIFVIPPDQHASTCEATFDKPEDQDGDGTGTGLFASEPNPFVMTCGAVPLPICWVSDHSGNQFDLTCQGGKEPHSPFGEELLAKKHR